MEMLKINIFPEGFLHENVAVDVKLCREICPHSLNHLCLVVYYPVAH